MPKKKQLSKWMLFGIYVAIYFAINFLLDRFVFTAELYHRSWSEQLEAYRIDELLSQQKNLSWTVYLFIPLLVYLKVILPAGCIYIYLVLQDKKIPWSRIFRLTLEAETILLLPMILRLLWFILVPPDSLQDIADFSPWSFGFLLENSSPAYLKFIFQAVNVFEGLYIIALVAGLRAVLHNTLGQSARIIASSYCLGLIGWLAIASFIFIQNS